MKKNMERLLCLICAITLSSSKSFAFEKNENQIPDNVVYEKGKVKIECDINVPDDIKNEICQKEGVVGRYTPDKENVFEFAENISQIKDSQSDELSYRIELQNNSFISAEKSFSYITENYQYYSRIGLSEDDIKDVETETDSQKTEDVLNKVKRTIGDLGYPVESLNFYWTVLDHNFFKQAENECFSSGAITEDQRKSEWTDQDDLYVIYAYQEKDDMPIFHEIMSMYQQFAKQSMSNAPVQVFCSGRGIEWMMITYIYEFDDQKEPINLVAFDQILDNIEEKYNSILDNSIYCTKPLARRLALST